MLTPEPAEMKLPCSISGAKKCRLIRCPCAGQSKNSRRQQKLSWDEVKLLISNILRAAQQQSYNSSCETSASCACFCSRYYLQSVLVLSATLQQMCFFTQLRKQVITVQFKWVMTNIPFFMRSILQLLVYNLSKENPRCEPTPWFLDRLIWDFANRSGSRGTCATRHFRLDINYN